MDKKYIIFDFDGTLVNTNDIIVASWQATFEHYLGCRKPVREIEATFGETLMHTIGVKLPGAPVNEVVNYYRAYQDTHQEDHLVYAFEGIRELMDELRARGCRIGVATSRTTYSFNNYMKKLGMENTVDEVVTMDDVTRHKPDPETFEVCLAKLAGCPADAIPEDVRKAAVMIGDTKFDIGCANNADVDSVLVGWSHYVDEEDMAESGYAPTYRISRPEELLELI